MAEITWGTVLICTGLACVGLLIAWVANLILRKATKLEPSRRIAYAVLLGIAVAYVVPWVLRRLGV